MKNSLFLSTLFIFSILLFGCENDMTTVHKIASMAEVNVENIKTVETYYSDAGKVKARLNAPVLNVFQTGEHYKELPEGLTLTFFNDSLKEDGRITALYGISYDTKNLVVVKRNVVVVNIKGEKLNTEELTWDINKHMLFTDKFVKITTGSEQIFGEGLEAREDFTNYKIKKIKNSTVKVKNDLDK